MPYIKKNDRAAVLQLGAKNAGQLNFVLTNVIHIYLEDNGTSYQTMNDILGALDGCSKEFYRRKVAPYEDIKIQENGDV